jgi:hypothetical protein
MWHVMWHVMWRGGAVLLLLAGCAGPGAPNLGCSGEVRLRNQGAATVEQVYLSPAGPADWGQDRLAPGVLPPGAEARLSAAPGRNAVRVVFANGRAAEMAAMDVCATPELTIQPAGLLAGR